MATRHRRARQLKQPVNFQEVGRRATIVGAAFLIGPQFLGNSVVGNVVASSLSLPGWLILSFGVIAWGASTFGNNRLKRIPSKPAVHWNTYESPATASPPAEPAAWKPGRSQVSNARPVKAPNNPTTTNVRSKPSQWSSAVFAAIEWRRFEAVCEALFAQAGFESRSQSHGADGGVDIWLHSRNAEGPVAVVQCKHWQGKAVGVKELREFFGVMASHKLHRGSYATTSTYTSDALQFAKDNSINALDGTGLLALIAKRTPEQQKALLDVAYEGEYWRPTCASCGIKMVERTPSKGGANFWGCTDYPRCKSRLPMVAAMR